MLLLASLSAALVGCAQDSDLGSEEDARRAYLGLDGSIEKTLDLGMAGFNEAASANIPTQSGQGDVSGSITIDGQVDQGASDNKGLRLTVALVDYSDGPAETVEDDDIDITYDGIEGTATLDLTISGTIEDDGGGGVSRTRGNTHVTGVARSGDATFEIDVMI